MKKYYVTKSHYKHLFVYISTMALLSFNLYSQPGFIIRPYCKAGLMLSPPNTADLDYEVDGTPGGLDDLQTVKKFVYGAGCKLLISPKPDLFFGIDIGLQKLFYSEVQFDLTSTTYFDYQTDREWGLYLNPLVEFNKNGTPFYFDAGPSLNIVFWDWNYYYGSYYSERYNEDGGTEVSFGLSAEAGFKMKISPSVSVPISFRSDLMFRYGVLFQVGITIGIESKQ